MILSKGVNPSENLGVSSFPSHPVLSLLLLSSPFPSFPFPSFSLPSPSILIPLPRSPSPGGPRPLNQLGRLGERCKLPQWGLGRSPSRQTIRCISGPKGAPLFCVSFSVCTTGLSYHSRIVCANDLIELAIFLYDLYALS